MMYDRRSSFERRANLHYEDIEEDAAYIASEVIRRGRSPGWAVEPEEQDIAAAIEELLSDYNIGLVGPGTWARKMGGSHVFKVMK